jgi:hypothetical protein
MMTIRCPKCHDIVPFKKTLHEMHWCSCKSLGTDWITGTDRFRIVGKYEEVEAD